MSGQLSAVQLFTSTLADGARLFRLAPIIPLIAILPELYQHWVEIGLGMFDSRESMREVGLHPDRLSAGMIKVLGVSIAAFFGARVWINFRDGNPWWSVKSIAWKPFNIAFVLMMVASIPSLPQVGLPPVALLIVTVVIWIVTLPLLTLMMGAILGDTSVTLASVYRSGWKTGLRILLLTIASVAIFMVIHYANHFLALGQSSAVVWALMIWDSLVVGLLAVVMGTALHHGYTGGRNTHENTPAQAA